MTRSATLASVLWLVSAALAQAPEVPAMPDEPWLAGDAAGVTMLARHHAGRDVSALAWPPDGRRLLVGTLRGAERLDPDRRHARR